MPRRVVSEKLKLYRECMSKEMTGKKFENVIERRKYFCAMTKVCSGKVKTIEEAKKLCLEKHPEWKA